MILYRIAKKAFASDISGEGARLYGGRWNPKGVAVLYAAENRALATVEYLVHVPIQLLPSDLYIARLDVPDTTVEALDSSLLCDDWCAYPAPSALADIGRKWVEEARSLCLRVPSVVVKDEWNTLINPRHSDFSRVSVSSVEPYEFDSRLLRR